MQLESVVKRGDVCREHGVARAQQIVCREMMFRRGSGIFMHWDRIDFVEFFRLHSLSILLSQADGVRQN